MEQINTPIIIKADPGGDLNTWGIKINVNYDNQEQFYLDATNAINYILDNMGITRAELQDLLDEGEALVTELNDKIIDGTVLLSQLNNAILTGDSLKTDLELMITNAETAQSNLETATTNAITANDNLDTAITTAGTTQTALDLSISDAITANTNLDTAISNASTVQTSLQGVVDNANAINTTLGNTIVSANNINTTLGNTTSTANAAKTNLDGSISTATALKTNLDASIVTGTQLKNDIDAQILAGDLIQKGVGFNNVTYPFLKNVTDILENKTDKTETNLNVGGQTGDYENMQDVSLVLDGVYIDFNTGVKYKCHTPTPTLPSPSPDFVTEITNKNLQKQIENLSVDFVIASGVDYTKWNSGKLECFGRCSVSTAGKLNNLPKSFIDQHYMIAINPDSTSDTTTFLATGNRKSVDSFIGICANFASQGHTSSYYAVGRWK